MKLLIEKLRFMTAAFFLLAAMSTFVVGNHQTSEESSVKLVDAVEVVELNQNRSQRRVQQMDPSGTFLTFPPNSAPKMRPSCRFFKPPNERDCHNGLGGYLLT